MRADGPAHPPVLPRHRRGGIYGLINNSPKRRDLTANGRYAIHSFPLEDRDDEFMLAGIAKRVTDPAEVIAVKKAYDEAGATSGEDEWTFEFSIERALLSVYNPGTAGCRSAAGTCGGDDDQLGRSG
jgi:hypothetical protein